tara:strand:- start:1178 stop:1282 length:105 start_codon:yes stop_codon:yes gene_type:complete
MLDLLCSDLDATLDLKPAHLLLLKLEFEALIYLY